MKAFLHLSYHSCKKAAKLCFLSPTSSFYLLPSNKQLFFGGVFFPSLSGLGDISGQRHHQHEAARHPAAGHPCQPVWFSDREGGSQDQGDPRGRRQNLHVGVPHKQRSALARDARSLLSRSPPAGAAPPKPPLYILYSFSNSRSHIPEWLCRMLEKRDETKFIEM